MTYTVLVSDQEISVNQFNRLSDAGAVVPFDSEGYNCYIYVPDTINIETIENLIPCTNTYLTVKQEEVDKQLNKLHVVNRLHKDDIVFYHDKYRRLPLHIVDERADDNNSYEYHVKSVLRGFDVDEWVPNISLRKPEQYFSYDCYLPTERRKKLVIDLDSIPIPIISRITYIHALVLLLMRIKGSNYGYTIIVSNPDDITLYVCQILGLMVSYGDIRGVLKTYTDVSCFTTDFTLLAYCNNILYIDKNNLLCSIDNEEFVRKYHLNTRNIEYAYQNYNKGVKRISSKEAEPTDIQPYDIYSNIDNISIQEVTNLLVTVGLQSFASNTQFIIRELHE